MPISLDDEIYLMKLEQKLTGQKMAKETARIEIMVLNKNKIRFEETIASLDKEIQSTKDEIAAFKQIHTEQPA